SAYAVAGYIRTLQQYGLAVIAKLSSDTVLYLPAKPSSVKKRGCPAKYGQKIKLADIDDRYLIQTIQKNTHTEYIYQITGYQKS
ncbi:MAG: hypothetical protein NZ455_13525, partial [Bacteroidia bacterium]|nr:hypothetical protein [Bacteroidia bacterium]